MRSARLLSLLLLLQARGRMTARQLADELEVSPRTIYRDVEMLHTAGIPLYGDAGHTGGYQLLDGYSTQLTGLTAKEAETLFLTGMPGPAKDLGCGAFVAAIQLKLHAALSPELRERAISMQQRFHLDTPGWYQEGDRSPYLTSVADAVWNQHRVRVCYGDPNQMFTLDPYGVVLNGGAWHIVAGCLGNIGTYRVNRILRLHTLTDRFARPAGFDLAGYWQAHLAEVNARQTNALVRLSPTGAQQLLDTGTPLVINALDRTATDPDEHGWITATLPVDSPAQLLMLGAQAEVLGPSELRNRLAATARSLTTLYEP